MEESKTSVKKFPTTENKIYFMPAIKTEKYEDTLFNGKEVYVFEQMSGTYFSLIVKSSSNIHTTVGYKSADSSGRINSLVFNTNFKKRLLNLLEFFFGIDYQLYGVHNNDDLYFYAIGINDNIIDMDDTIDILKQFNFKMPPIYYNGIFNNKQIEKIYNENSKIFIRSDYTRFEPKFVLSIFNKSKKIPNKISKNIIQKIDFFLEEERDNIYEDVISEFLAYESKNNNIKEFISFFVYKKFTEYKEEFLKQFTMNEYKEEAVELLKKKFSFKVKSITEE